LLGFVVAVPEARATANASLDPAPVLATHGLSRRFGRRWAVRSVDTAFHAGELVVVLGHNGAGKSTFLNLIAGRMRPTEGHAVVLGETLVGFPSQAVRTQLGFLGHAPFVYPELTGLENMRFMARLAGMPVDQARLLDILERVGLEASAKRPAGTYSRGMTQRLALGRLLLTQPPIWLLDEPTTGLDADGRRWFVAALAEAKDQGSCIIVVTHAPDLLSGVLDRTLTLDNGRLRKPPQAEASV
jgi:heme exporter protein A